MAEKIVVGADGTPRRVALTADEVAARTAEETAHANEIARRAARSTEARLDEEILQPGFDAAANEAKLLRATALVLLDGLNLERQARGASPISPGQLRNQVRAKLATL